MGRRKAKQSLALRAGPEVMPVSARIAWTYLASLLAAIAAAGLVTLATQSLARVVCQSTTADAASSCRMGLYIWVALLGFLVCLIPLARVVKLDWLLIISMWAGAALWLASDSIGDWWWWAIGLLLPASAAAVSADWERGPKFRRCQWIVVSALAVAGLAAVIWWYVNG
jgi:hypothetical protein